MDVSPLICTYIGEACSSKRQKAQRDQHMSGELSCTSHKTDASRTALHAASSSPLYPSAELAMVQSWRKLLAAALSFDVDPNGCDRNNARLGSERSGKGTGSLWDKGRRHTDWKSTQAPGVLRQRMPLLREMAGGHEAAGISRDPRALC